jgi:hypothetical protein
MAELSGTVAVGPDNYNSTANGKIEYPVVADPADTVINQGYLGFKSTYVDLLLGRQRIKLDNDRFIGNVGWRQIEQTYDAYTAVGKITDKTVLFASHVENVNRVFGEHNPDPAKANTDTATELFNLAHDFSFGKLTGYAYLIELKDTPAASHKDFGVRFTGAHELSDKIKLHYTAEYADQSAYKDAPSTVGADYTFVEFGVTAAKVTAKGGYEILGGDGVWGFSTPFATLHAFNGWTDQFLATPADGLEDLYLTVSGKVKGWKLLGVYHDFSANNSGADFGNEWGALVAKTFHKRYAVGLKFAAYSAGVPELNKVDTSKAWIWFQIKS